jgi:hypothetical protein
MATRVNPNHCVFCGYYLTIDEKYAGQRCVDPAHWQASGRLAPRDFYALARLVAKARAEFPQRPIHRTIN